jgi:hypothetical protein
LLLEFVPVYHTYKVWFFSLRLNSRFSLSRYFWLSEKDAQRDDQATWDTKKSIWRILCKYDSSTF